MNDEVFEVPILKRYLLLHSAYFDLSGVLKLVGIAGHGSFIEAGRSIEHVIEWQASQRLHLMDLVTLIQVASGPLFRPLPLLFKQMSKRRFLAIGCFLGLLLTGSDLSNFPVILNLLEQFLLRLPKQCFVACLYPIFILFQDLFDVFPIDLVFLLIVSPFLLFNGFVA